jgi:ribonuclease Z
LGPSRIGKKLTFCGDCYENSSHIAELAKNSDVLIHESTLEDAFQQKAISNGHSTPSMASAFANLINAKCLILNHFSQRYKPLNYVAETSSSSSDNIENENLDIVETVQKLIDEAKLTFNGSVCAAYDFFSFKV